MLVQSIDSTTRQHLQTVLHHMDLHHWQRTAGLECHRIHSKIEVGIGGWNQHADFHPRVAHQGLGRHVLLGADKGGGRGMVAQGFTRLLNH